MCESMLYSCTKIIETSQRREAACSTERERMKFAVKAWSNGRARAGVIHLGSCANTETPCLLLSTRKGLPNFISPDLLPSLPSPDSHLLQFSPLHFIDGPSPKTISTIGGLHQMLGLHEYGFVALPRDSISCLPEWESTNKIGASFETPSGRHLVRPAQYMEMISSMKPNLWVTLADEVPASVSMKRNKTSVDRSVRWLDECVALSLAGGAVFGAIVGGSNVLERQRCAQEVVKQNLSEEKPRLVSGLGLPEEVLQGVAAGIDLFDSTYIYLVTLGGFALTFPLNKIERRSSDFELSDTGSDQSKINLRATVYRKDTSAIVENCKCYTCQNHTKAYINHLLNVHEMLAQTLLEIHNTHHYLCFFRSIREAIKAGKFEQFRKEFITSRRDHLAGDALCERVESISL